MQDPHHPKVSRRNDGCWVVNCPECQRGAHNASEVPIGIGIALDSEVTADRLVANHTSRQIDNDASEAHQLNREDPAAIQPRTSKVESPPPHQTAWR